MVKKFTFLFLFFLSIQINSQVYVPLPLQNCTWYNTFSIWCYQTGWPTSQSSASNSDLFPNGDTILGGKRYIKIYNISTSCFSNSMCPIGCPSNTTASYSSALRQDTLGKKIYQWNPSTGSEQLLYNFNLVKGDSVKTTLGTYTASIPPGGDPYRIVDSVYYQYYNDGICRKTWKLKPYPNTVGLTEVPFIIEGIGNSNGLFTKSASIYTGSFSSNTQYFFGSQLAINNFTLASATGTCSTVGLINKDPYANDPLIYPNPVQDKLIINGSNLQITTIEMTSVVGEKQNIKIDGSQNNFLIDTSELPAGIYFIKFTDNGINRCKRVIKAE